MRAWSFQHKLSMGFFGTILLTLVNAGASVLALHTVASSKDTLLFQNAQDLIDVEKLRTVLETRVADARAYAVGRRPETLERLHGDDARFRERLDRVRSLSRTHEDEQMLDRIRDEFEGYAGLSQRVIEMRRAGRSDPSVSAFAIREIRPRLAVLDTAVLDFVHRRELEFQQARLHSTETARRSLWLLVWIALSAILIAVFVGWTLLRTLTLQYTDSQKATRLREEILGIVAHDLKNPLSTILMNAALLAKLVQNPERLSATTVGRAVTNVESSARRMNRLIHDLLDLGKIEAGSLVIEHHSEMILGLLTEAIEMMRPLAAARRIELELRIEGCDGVFECDRDRLMQVFGNLIGNAIKFTPAGGAVTVSARQSASETEFSVNDSGPGIPDAELPLLFRRYWQARATARQGTGLGLSIAKGIVESHHGSILARNLPGRGASFTFRIPNRAPAALRAA